MSEQGYIPLESLDFSDPAPAEVDAAPEAEAPPPEVPPTDTAPKTEPVEAKAEEAKAEESEPTESTEEPPAKADDKPTDVLEQKVTVKVKGRDRELSVKQLADYYNRNHGLENTVREKVQEFRQLEGEVRSLMNDIKADPNVLWELAQRLGHDPAKVAYEYLERRVQWDQMPEPERRARALAEENARLRQAEEARRAEYTRAEQERAAREADQRTLQELTDQWTAALSVEGLPANRYTLARMAAAAQELIQQYGPITAEDAPFLAQQVREEMENEIKALPPDRLTKVRPDLAPAPPPAPKEPTPKAQPTQRPRDGAGRFLGQATQRPQTTEELMAQWEAEGVLQYRQ